MKGTVSAWGDNSNGQLGIGKPEDHHAPVETVDLSGVAKVESGSGHILVLMEDGTVSGWGRNAFGQTGDRSTENRYTPAPVKGLSEVRQLAPGGGHSIALLQDGTVWSWGAGFFGMLGPITLGVQMEPAPIEGLSGVTRIASGGSHNLALLADGTVSTWGRDDHGQLGDGPGGGGKTDRFDREYMGRHYPCRTVPSRVAGIDGEVVDVAAGGGHSLVLLSDGTVMAWGYDDRGQLGDGAWEDQYAPVVVKGLSGVKELTAGYHHSLALLEDGTVWAWGLNDGGQCGDGSTEHRPVPVQVKGIQNAVAIATNGGGTDVDPGNGGHCLALLEDGTVMAWGWNNWGQLGDGTTTNRLTPVKVRDLNGARGIAAGGEIPQFRENPGGGYSLALL